MSPEERKAAREERRRLAMEAGQRANDLENRICTIRCTINELQAVIANLQEECDREGALMSELLR